MLQAEAVESRLAEERADTLEPEAGALRDASGIWDQGGEGPEGSGGPLRGMGHQSREQEVAALQVAQLQPQVNPVVSSDTAGTQVGAFDIFGWLRAGQHVGGCICCVRVTLVRRCNACRQQQQWQDPVLWICPMYSCCVFRVSSC
jgi:hypothetical protein